MKRIALLGATGSIGRQAIEVIDAHPELELVAAASGSQPIEGLAPLTQTGGDLTELLERAEPDLVLNAVVGFAALAPTMWALEPNLGARPRDSDDASPNGIRTIEAVRASLDDLARQILRRKGVRPRNGLETVVTTL